MQNTSWVKVVGNDRPGRIGTSAKMREPLRVFLATDHGKGGIIELIQKGNGRELLRW